MDFVTHLPRTVRKHDAVWVIVDRLTKSANFLVVLITFTPEEFYRDSLATWSASLYCIGQKSQVYGSLLEELLEGHGYAVDDEYCKTREIPISGIRAKS